MNAIVTDHRTLRGVATLRAAVQSNIEDGTLSYGEVESAK